MRNATEISSHVTEFPLMAVLLVTTTLKLNIYACNPDLFSCLMSLLSFHVCLVVMVFLAHHE